MRSPACSGCLATSGRCWCCNRPSWAPAGTAISSPACRSRIRCCRVGFVRLREEGLLEPRVYQSNPPRSEYLTTPRSRSLWPMLVSIWSWERHWVPEHTGELPRMHHTVCDEDFVPQVELPLVRRTRQRERRCRAVGPKRILGAVGTRCRDPATVRPSQAGLFPQTMTCSATGGRSRSWSQRSSGSAGSPTTRHSSAPHRVRSRTEWHLHGQRRTGHRRQSLPPHREGPRPLPGADIGAAVGAAVVSARPRVRRWS